MPEKPLPDPGSDAVMQLLGGSRQVALYGLLHRRRANPPTSDEVDFYLQNVAGEPIDDISKVLAPIKRHFLVTALDGTPIRYRLDGWRDTDRAAASQPISLRLRAEVLAPQRCAQCGEQPLTHGVRLQPAQRIPLNWGGTMTRENLEPLCEECLVGRRQYFARWDHAAEKIAEAVNHDDPRMRLGELLRVMSPEWVRADLLEAVACAKDYQDDWTRRLRDLRFLGWDYSHQNRKTEGARTWAYYRLKKTAPWPENIHATIKREAAARQAKRKAQGDPEGAAQPVS